MPSVKDLSRYPASYIKLILLAYDADWEKTYDSHKAAVHARKDLYNFREALRRRAMKTSNRRLNELWTKAQTLTFSVQGQNLVISRPRHLETPSPNHGSRL